MLVGSRHWAREVVAAVSKVTGVKLAAIYGTHKHPRTVAARVSASCIMRTDSSMSNAEVGEALERHPSSISGYRWKYKQAGIRQIVAAAREQMEAS